MADTSGIAAQIKEASKTRKRGETKLKRLNQAHYEEARALQAEIDETIAVAMPSSDSITVLTEALHLEMQKLELRLCALRVVVKLLGQIKSAAVDITEGRAPRTPGVGISNNDYPRAQFAWLAQLGNSHKTSAEACGAIAEVLEPFIADGTIPPVKVLRRGEQKNHHTFSVILQDKLF